MIHTAYSSLCRAATSSVVLALAVIAGCSSRAPLPPPPGVLAAVNIRVRSEGGDNKSIQGAKVTISVRGEKVTATTDQGGWVKWINVDPGPRHVWVTAKGYHDFDQHFVVQEPFTALTVAIRPAPAVPEPGTGRKGRVRLAGHVLIDDDGPFASIGVSLFWAMCAAERGDWDRLDRNLAFVRENGGTNYVRILGEVGGNYWRDCQINPRRSAYVSELRQVLDHIGRAGMRAEITIFGGLTFSRTDAQRRETIRKVLQAIKGREHLVQNVEIANEPFHEAIGFRDYGRGWVENIRELGRYYLEQERAMSVKPMLLALGSPGMDLSSEWHCQVLPELYAGFPDGRMVATIHYDRNMSTSERWWRHVRQPWFEGDAYCRGSFDAVLNDEPSGPGASVNVMDSVSAHAAMAAVTFIAGGTGSLFHAHGGIVGYGANAKGKPNIYSHSNAAPILRAMRSVRNLLPSDIANWRSVNWDDGGPFHDGAHFWPYEGGDGFVSLYSACNGATCWTVATGVRGRPHVRAAYRQHVTVYGYTGKVLQDVSLPSGGGVTLHGDGDPFNDRSDVLLIRSVDR